MSARLPPLPGRPAMPESYGLARAPAHATPAWRDVSEKLAKARNYWISTTGAAARPHAVPVWGLWLGDVFYFATDSDSIKGRHLTFNPSAVVHLESGDDVVILEGPVEEVRDPMGLDLCGDAYDSKYGIRPRAGEAGTRIYALRPRTAFTWHEKDFPTSATRWRFRE